MGSSLDLTVLPSTETPISLGCRFCPQTPMVLFVLDCLGITGLSVGRAQCGKDPKRFISRQDRTIRAGLRAILMFLPSKLEVFEKHWPDQLNDEGGSRTVREFTFRQGLIRVSFIRVSSVISSIVIAIAMGVSAYRSAESVADSALHSTSMAALASSSGDDSFDS